MGRLWPGAEDRRRWMIEAIENEARLCAHQTGRPRIAPKVLDAMAAIPRERFVPLTLRAAAYDNSALPVGHGQTISQPFIVALMTDLLDLEEGDRVLEIGTGTGYQTAILAWLGCEVWTIERIAALSEAARKRLAGLGLDARVHFRVGDGWEGWQEAAPFHGIIVTAAPPSVPEALVEQLAPGGRLVIPIGEPGFGQELVRIEKRADGSLDARPVLPVAFVPMVRD